MATAISSPPAPVSAFEQNLINHRLVLLLHELEMTPVREQMKPAFRDKLLELHSLCASDEIYYTLVTTYDLG